MPSLVPSSRARWDLPLPPQPMMAIRSTVPDPSEPGRTRGTGRHVERALVSGGREVPGDRLVAVVLVLRIGAC
jgi:hypothetical protein